MKQRIVGALVLVAVAAVVVPIVFDLHHDNATLVRPVGIPPMPKDFTVRVLPLVHPDKQDPDAQVTAAGPAAATVPGDVPVAAAPSQAPAAVPTPAAAPEAIPATVASAAPQPAAPPAAPAAADSAPQAWAVQVGSFSSEDRAVSLRDRLRRQNFTAYVEKVTLDSGHDSYRVQVGPELQRSDAERLEAQLQRDVKLHGIVVSH